MRVKDIVILESKKGKLKIKISEIQSKILTKFWNCYPDKINEFLEYIATYTKQVYTPKWEEIKESELSEVKGLLQVDDKKDEIDESLKPIVQRR